MKKQPIISALLNFFTMGLGYVYNGKRILLGIGFTLGAIALTYVEFQIKPLDATLYNIMFATVFLINTCFAIDGYKEAKSISNENKNH